MWDHVLCYVSNTFVLPQTLWRISRDRQEASSLDCFFFCIFFLFFVATNIIYYRILHLLLLLSLSRDHSCLRKYETNKGKYHVRRLFLIQNRYCQLNKILRLVTPGRGPFNFFDQTYIQERFGFSNICTNWDYVPSRELTAILYPIFEYSLITYLLVELDFPATKLVLVAY